MPTKEFNIPGRAADKYFQQYSDFIDLAAHDLQSPLRKLEVLVDGLVNKYRYVEHEDAQEYVRRIRNAISSMRSLVEGFTEMATVVPDSMSIEKIDLNNIIKKSILEIEQNNGLLATVDISGLPTVSGDRKQLELLFKKLLENAYRFKRQDIPLKISITSEELNQVDKEHHDLQPGTYYKVMITDNGIGFEQRDQENVFKPLVRLNGKSAYPGNGLGLAVAKKIADNHGAVIYAEGNRAEGAKIILIIPENKVR
jgi:signal transduction histidine kinase